MRVEADSSNVTFFAMVGSTFLGGGETAIRGWSQGLVERGNRVKWWVPEGIEKAQKGQGNVPEGVMVNCLTSNCKYPGVITNEATRRVKKQIVEDDPRALIFNSSIPLGFLRLYIDLLKSGFAKKMFVVSHADPNVFNANGRGLKSEIKWFVKKWMMKMGERVGVTQIAVSNFVAGKLQSEGWVNNPVVCYPPTSLEDRCEPSLKEKIGDRINVLTVSRISQEKGIDFLIQVAQRCRELSLPVAFSLVGVALDQNYGQNMRDKGEGIIDFQGSKIGEELCNEYRRADVFLNPSPNEAFGLTTVEALRHGTPVIAGYAAINEIFPKEGPMPGRKIDRANTVVAETQVIDYLAALKEHPELIQQASKVAIETGAKFEPREIIHKFVNTVIG